MGFRLVAGKYKPIEADPDGSLRSKELGLRLCPEGYYLALYDIKTGERLLNMEEIGGRFDEVQQKVSELQAELARLKAAQSNPKGK